MTNIKHSQNKIVPNIVNNQTLQIVMKKLFLFTLIISSSIMAFGQSKMACCKQSATQQFAMLASDKKFVMSHPKPLPFHFQSSIGKAITADAYELKAKTPTNNYILVVHEYFGLNDYVKKESEDIYNDLGNVNIIDLDLYDGKSSTDRAEAAKLMQAVKDDRAEAIIKGAIAYAGPKAHIATLGWCFGGGWSLQASLLAGKQAVACVMFYGMPEKDVNKLKTLHTDVLGNFANLDQWINTKVVAQFADDMKAAGKKLYLHQYDAGHGFANPSSQSSNPTAATDAYKNTIAFYKERLK